MADRRDDEGEPRPQVEAQAGTHLQSKPAAREAEVQSAAVVTDKREPKPIIGFLGLVLIIIGYALGTMAESSLTTCISLPVIVAGVSVLVYALFAGHVKIWG